MAEVDELDVADVLPMERETLQERVYRELRQLLMVGRFRPGQLLKIRDLAAVFGTSVQPVRESIRQLIAERALEAAPNSSTRVLQLTPAQLEDLRLVRRTVEGLAGELAARAAKPADVAELTAILDEEQDADNQRQIEASVSRNMEFHFRLYRLAGSAELYSIIEGLWLRLGPVIREAAENFDGTGGKGAHHHVDMLKALRRNDPVALRQAVEQDIDRFFDLILRVRESERSPTPGARAAVAQRPEKRALVARR